MHDKGKSVRFIESPSNYLSLLLELLEGPKDGKIKENAKFFFILKSSNKVHYISALNYWSRGTHYL